MLSYRFSNKEFAQEVLTQWEMKDSRLDHATLRQALIRFRDLAIQETEYEEDRTCDTCGTKI